MTEQKTCATCAAYDAPKGECHRVPADPWPKMAAVDWCMEHSPKRDASGWREDWPKRDDLIAVLAVEPLTQAQILAKLPETHEQALRSALHALTESGYITRKNWRYSALPEGLERAGICLSKPVSETEVLRQFPTSPQTALPMVTIKRKAMHNLAITDGEFKRWRSELVFAGLIARVQLAMGEERWFRS